MRVKQVILLILILCSIPVMHAHARAAAPADAIKPLTVDDAVKNAVSRSSELKNLDENAHLNELARDTLQRAVVQNVSEAQHINNRVSIMQNDLRQAMMSDNVDLQKLLITFSVTRYFSAIISAERDYELFERGLELNEKNLEVAKVKTELGLMNANAYDTMKTNYEKDVISREIRIVSIDNAYRALNHVMGKELGLRYELEMDIEYEPLHETDLPKYITAATDDNMGIKAKENELKVLQYRLSLTSAADVSDELEVNISQAARAVTDAKANLNDKITACYKDIQIMETQIELSEKDYDEMKNQLAIKETLLELGRTTQMDVDNYLFSMMQQEYKILEQIANHYIKKMQFDNPDLL